MKEKVRSSYPHANLAYSTMRSLTFCMFVSLHRWVHSQKTLASLRRQHNERPSRTRQSPFDGYRRSYALMGGVEEMGETVVCKVG